MRTLLLRRKSARWFALALVCMAAFTGCDAGLASEDADAERAAYVAELLAVPPGFATPPVPAHNPVTPEKAALGERLFFDTILSRDRTVSCATCHEPRRAFTDGLARSLGVEGRTTLRNSPSLVGVAYLRDLFWDGGAISLEQQALGPLEEPTEMDANLAELLERLRADASYAADFEAAFGEGPSVQTLTFALATFQRTLLPTGSRYDRHRASEPGALAESERRGLAVFERSGCASCHAGPMLTTSAFEHNGLAATPADSGRARITHSPSDVGVFRVPSLRNVALTAPYMHDGRFADLEQVVRHYDAGGVGHANQSARVRPLGLTAAERADLVAFLEALSDEAVP